MLLIERAYTALRTLHDGDNVTAVDRMCASAMSQMEPIDVERKPDDCIIDVDDVTDYVISTCSTFTNCRLTSNTILRINSDEQESKCASIAISHPIISYPYISVDYECTPGN
jgi:hypothetical protein